MQLFGASVFERQQDSRGSRKQAGNRLRAVAVALLTVSAGMPSGFAQQPAVAAATAEKAASDLPSAPAPVPTQPLNLRQSKRDFSKPAGGFLANPINAYRPATIAKASFDNSVRLSDLVKNGKIYLSLSDALALALENNYDIAISRYYMDLADLDLMRAKAGQLLQGSGATVNTNTQGGYSSSTVAGGGPGGSTGASAAGSGGLTITASGAGPMPESYLDPSVTANLQFDRATSPSSSFFTGGKSTTNTYDFTYNQGFVTGTAFQFSWNNSKATSTNPTTTYSPLFNAGFKAQVSQHLLQGAGIWVNRRFVIQAVNNRRITDSTFRQQILYTVNQVENIYWGLVNAYEDVQAKELALDQSSKLAADNRKQLEIGTLAPLDVVNSDSAVAADKQALISSQSTLNYQQQIIKQAIARNLNDPALVAAAVIPTDRVSIEEIPEEKQPVDELVQQAFKNSPVLEQAVLALKNDEISLRGAKNGLLPTVDVYGYLSGSGVAGSINSNLNCRFYPTGDCPTSNPNANPAEYMYVPPAGYGTALGNAFNNSSPDKGFGFNITIPIRNRAAQAEQAAALIQYRQAELRLEQLYTQIRMQVVNAQFALTNDRALVQASIAAKDYAQQSLDAEIKKLRLGASTTANVLLQEKNQAAAQNTLLASEAAYARDRAGLYQTLANTLDHYGINLQEAATGNVSAAPVVPGLTPASGGNEPTTVPPTAQ
jgi:outer membrane protein TolC